MYSFLFLSYFHIWPLWLCSLMKKLKNLMKNVWSITLLAQCHCLWATSVPGQGGGDVWSITFLLQCHCLWATSVPGQGGAKLNWSRRPFPFWRNWLRTFGGTLVPHSRVLKINKSRPGGLGLSRICLFAPSSESENVLYTTYSKFCLKVCDF